MHGNLMKNQEKVKAPRDGLQTTPPSQEPKEITISSVDQDKPLQRMKIISKHLPMKHKLLNT